MYDQMNNGMMNGMPMGGMMAGGIPTGTGYQYNGVQPGAVPQFKNFLSDEEIQKLIQKENQFSLAVTETEKLRAACNHRDPKTGRDTITEDANGNCTCYICQYKFNPVDSTMTKDSLFDAVKEVIDILQTIKMLYFDMPAEVAREFFVIIPLLEKIPELFERAAKCYAKYDSINMYGYNNKNMNTMQMYNILTGILNGGNTPNYVNNGYTAPTYNPYDQQTMGFNQMGQPMMSNGFVAMNQPIDPNAYAAQTNNFQYNPNYAQQPQQAAPAGTAQQAPQSQSATTDGKTVNVEANFKA